MKWLKQWRKKLRQVPTLRVVRLVMAFYILVILLSQLFTFEDFPGLIESIGVSVGWAAVLAMLLVFIELLSLPFWLEMPLRRAFRRVSFVAGVIAMLMLSALEVVAYQHDTSLIFGATLDFPGGSWSLLFLSGLWLLLIWASGVLQRFVTINRSTVQ